MLVRFFERRRIGLACSYAFWFEEEKSSRSRDYHHAVIRWYAILRNVCRINLLCYKRETSNIQYARKQREKERERREWLGGTLIARIEQNRGKVKGNVTRKRRGLISKIRRASGGGAKGARGCGAAFYRPRFQGVSAAVVGRPRELARPTA